MSEPMKVNMLATARNVQWSANTFLGFGSVKLVAPAKVNLFLGVGARREDGYHDVVNVMHALALHDTLYMNCLPVERASSAGVLAGLGEAVDALAKGCLAEADLPDYAAAGGPEGNLLVCIDCADKVADDAAPGIAPLDVPARSNIVFKAIDALARELGRTARECIVVRLEKSIPHEGGLGGGSSDAAAALLGAARFWGVASDDPAVEKVARALGADVAFFLKGGCARFVGAGEIADGSLVPMKNPVVLVKPNAGVSTPEAYCTFDEAPVLIPSEHRAKAEEAVSAQDVPLFNNLEAAAHEVLPELEDVRAWLVAQEGVASSENVRLCGSGSTTFAIADSFAAACSIAAAAQSRGWWARATTLSALRAAELPQR